MSEPPQVTTVIPTRDRPDLVVRAIDLVLAQEGVCPRIVVVDDGSRPPLRPTGRRRGDGPVEILRRETSHGVASARNLGLAEVATPWTAFMDDDDLWAPDKLRRQIEAATVRGAAWAFAAAVNIDGDLGVIDFSPVPERRMSLQRLLLEDNVVPGGTSNVVAQTGLLRSVGGFDEHLGVLADWDLWIRLAMAAPVATLDEPLVGYVEHGQNMHLREGARLREELAYLLGKHADLLRAYDVDPRPTRYRWAAAVQRADGRRLPAAALLARSLLRTRSRRDAWELVGTLRGQAALDERRRAWTRRSGAEQPQWLGRYRSVAQATRP